MQTTAASYSQRSGTFVDVPTDISCPGNATQWNMCYYSSTSATSSTTNFGVYRLSYGTTYTLIAESLDTYNIARNVSAYACSQFTISPQYVVQPGDILVVCVQSSARLGVAGTSTTSILLDTGTCTSLPGTTINTNSYTYSTTNGVTLHISLGKGFL